jgi:hypothetical protein
MQTPPDNPFADVEFHVNHCPYCQAWIWLEEEQQDCAKCGKTVYRRQLPYEERHVLCRADQLEVVETAWDIFNGRDPELGRQRRQREKEKEQVYLDQKTWDSMLDACRTSRTQAQSGTSLSLGPDAWDLLWRELDKEHKNRGALLRLDLLRHEPLYAIPEPALLLRLPAYFIKVMKVAQAHPVLWSQAWAHYQSSREFLLRAYLEKALPRLKPDEDPLLMVSHGRQVGLRRVDVRSALFELTGWMVEAQALLCQFPQGVQERAQGLRASHAGRLKLILTQALLLEIAEADEVDACLSLDLAPEAQMQALNQWWQQVLIRHGQQKPEPKSAQTQAPKQDENPKTWQALDEEDAVEAQEKDTQIRNLYRSIVKRCHPDLTQDPVEKVRRDRLTALATLARDKGDLHILKHILSKLPA